MNRLMKSLALSGGIMISSAANAQNEGGLEKLAFDEKIVENLRQNDPTWELYGKDAEGTEFYIEEKDGKHSTVCFKNGREHFRKEVRPEIAGTIRSLYSFKGDITYEFNNNLGLQDIGKLREWNQQIADPLWRQPDEIVERAIDSLNSAGENSLEFLKAIELLSRGENRGETVGSAIWYLANIEGIKNEPENEPLIWYSTNERGLGFRRLNRETNEIERVRDLDVMDAETFYENVFYAVKVREEMPWGKDISVSDFLTHVLPARTTQEPLSRHRRHFYESLSPIMKEMNSPEEALMFINEMVNGLTRFEQTEFEDTGTYTRLMKHSERCEGLTNMVIDFAKGAAGIPAFHVSTPAWAKGNNNHTWTGMRANEGIKGIFSINSAYPDATDPHAFSGTVTAKVYARGPFGTVEDLTSSFTESGDLVIERGRLGKLPDGSSIYLNVVNFGIPVTVAETRLDAESGALFTDVGNKTGIVYFVSTNKSNWIAPRELEGIVGPLIFNEDDSVTYLSESHDPQKAERFSIKSGQSYLKIQDGKNYILSQWQGGRFSEVGTFYSERTTGNEFVVPSVPLSEGVLYLMHEEGSTLEANDLGGLYDVRPFIVKDGEIVQY